MRELLRQGLSNRQVAKRLGISLDGAKYHVSEILGKLGVSDRQTAAAWTPSRRAWWLAGSLAFLAWPFKSLLWGSTAKVAAAAAVAATVVAFAVPEGFGILVTDPDVGPIPDYPNFSYVTAASQVPLTDNPAWDGAGAWSPDCSRIAFTSNREGYPGVLADFGGRQNLPGDVYVMNSIGTGIVNLTGSPGGDEQPAWSPDGTRIAFSRHFQGNSDIYAMNSDGTGQTNLTNLAGLNRDHAWSPDGERLLFTRFRELASEVYVMNSDGTGQTKLDLFAKTPRQPGARWG